MRALILPLVFHPLGVRAVKDVRTLWTGMRLRRVAKYFMTATVSLFDLPGSYPTWRRSRIGER